MNIDTSTPKTPAPTPGARWCEWGQHWHIPGASYSCGPEGEREREKMRQYEEEEDERHRPELLNKLEAQIARLKAEYERLKNK